MIKFSLVWPVAPLIVLILLSCRLGLSSVITVPTSSLSVAGSQLCIYVHKSLLGAYASSRVNYINVQPFTNLIMDGVDNSTYSALVRERNLTVPRFSKLQKGSVLALVDDYDIPKKLSSDYPDLEVIPSFMYQLAITYNLNSSSISYLNLTREMLVGIFNKTVTNWNHTLLSSAADGPMPNASITVYLVGPKCALTRILTSGLARFDPAWNSTYGVVDVANSSYWFGQFNGSNGQSNSSYNGQSNSSYNPFKLLPSPDATLAEVANVPYSISYTGWINYRAAAKTASIAFVQNRAGSFVKPSTASFNASIAMNSTHMYHENKSLGIDIDYAGAYPFIGVSYIIVRKNPRNGTHINCTTAVEFLRYYRWLNRDPAAKAKLLSSFDIIPLPNATYDRTIVHLSNVLYCNDSLYGNQTVWNVMLKVIENEQPVNYAYYVLVGLVTPLVFIGFATYCVWKFLKWFHLRRRVYLGNFHIPAREIVFLETSKERYRQMLKMRPYLDNDLNTSFVTGEYGFCVVLLRPFHMAFNSASTRVRQELVHMQEWRTHRNLVRFLGVTEVHKDRYIVSELSLLGDLRTLLSNDTIQITMPVSFCMARGITDGLRYLHSQAIVHGNLRSTSIYVESDWTVKISDWEYVHLYSLQGIFASKEQIFKRLQRAPKEIQNIYLTPLLWTAPEILKAAQEQKGLQIYPSKESDCYSFGVIFYEIMTRKMPYHYDTEGSETGPMVTLLRIISPKKPLRPLDLDAPESLTDIPESMLRLMQSCWHVEPYRRATAEGMCLVFQKVEAETKRMADLTIVNTDFFIDKQKSDVKSYNSDLKQRVLDLRRACEDFLTPTVYERQKLRLPLEPQVAMKAYVMHLTMVDYAELLDPTHGESAIALIERFHTLINQHLTTIHDPNVFRVHTSGDDCTIVAGIPTVQLQHADAMAGLAFDLLSLTWRAVMLDIDTDHIKVRIGIHCGPVLAGLYGNDHTEFTIVGDTRDIAEDMERLSATYRILVSQDFLEDLREFSGYTYVLNTDEHRQHEQVTTYWLIGKADHQDQISLDEILAEYGAIEDGKIPAKSSIKKHKAAAAGAATTLTERAQSRRSSIAAHFASKEENRERPSILERRHAPENGRQSFPGTTLDPEILRNLSQALTQPGVDGDATFDIMRLGNNQEIIVVDFSQEDAERPIDNPLSMELSVIDENLNETLGVFNPVVAEISQTSDDLFSEGSRALEENLSNKTMKPDDLSNDAHEEPEYGEDFSQESSAAGINIVESAAGVNIVESSSSRIENSENYGLPDSVVTPLDESELEEATDTDDHTEDQELLPSPPSELPHSHESYRQRRKKKKRKHRPSIHAEASTENPHPHLLAASEPDTGLAVDSSPGTSLDTPPKIPSSHADLARILDIPMTRSSRSAGKSTRTVDDLDDNAASERSLLLETFSSGAVPPAASSTRSVAPRGSFGRNGSVTNGASRRPSEIASEAASRETIFAEVPAALAGRSGTGNIPSMRRPQWPGSVDQSITRIHSFPSETSSQELRQRVTNPRPSADSGLKTTSGIYPA